MTEIIKNYAFFLNGQHQPVLCNHESAGLGSGRTRENHTCEAIWATLGQSLLLSQTTSLAAVRINGEQWMPPKAP